MIQDVTDRHMGIQENSKQNRHDSKHRHRDKASACRSRARVDRHTGIQESVAEQKRFKIQETETGTKPARFQTQETRYQIQKSRREKGQPTPALGVSPRVPALGTGIVYLVW